MNTIVRSLAALSLALTAQGVGHAQSAAGPSAAGPYRVVKTYHVGGDAKYWDYVNFDQDRGLLYVSLGNHMAVIDAATASTASSLRRGFLSYGLIWSMGRSSMFIGESFQETNP